MVLYLFVTVIENGISVIKSSLISIEETKKFKDLLDTVLKKDTLFLEELQVKVEFQNNDLSVWHDVIYGLDENLEACIQLKVKHVRFTITFYDDNVIIINDTLLISQHLI